MFFNEAKRRELLVEFLYASALKKRFSCYGHFYGWRLGAEEHSCRSVLEIVDERVDTAEPNRLWERRADAVVVMMNPGSSRPLNRGWESEVRSYPEVNLQEKVLVLTQPDNTQYQVMRVAVACGWSHVRVLNLSDLRDPKSGSFLERVNALGDDSRGGLHSLFSAERSRECAVGLRRRLEPILVGWGQDMRLIQLAEQCVNRLDGAPIVGVESSIHPILNAHPSPILQRMKLAWLEQMIEQLEYV